MASKLEIYLLRHGASTANEQMLVCGSSDYPLSPKGISQAELVSQHLSKIPFDHIYASPLSRVRETLTNFNQKNNVTFAHELKELNTGSVSHITLPELWEKDTRYRQPWLSPELRYPKGETFREMTNRIISWYKIQQASWKDGNKILIAGHEGTLRSIYMYLFNLNLSNYPDFAIGNCDYLKFELKEEQITACSHYKLADLEDQEL